MHAHYGLAYDGDPQITLSDPHTWADADLFARAAATGYVQAGAVEISAYRGVPPTAQADCYRAEYRLRKPSGEYVTVGAYTCGVYHQEPERTNPMACSDILNTISANMDPVVLSAPVRAAQDDVFPPRGRELAQSDPLVAGILSDIDADVDAELDAVYATTARPC